MITVTSFHLCYVWLLSIFKLKIKDGIKEN